MEFVIQYTGSYLPHAFACPKICSMLYDLRYVFVDIDGIVKLSISFQNNIEIVIDNCKY